MSNNRTAESTLYEILSPECANKEMENLKEYALMTIDAVVAQNGQFNQKNKVCWTAIGRGLLSDNSWDIDRTIQCILANDNMVPAKYYGTFDPSEPKCNDFYKKYSQRGECQICFGRGMLRSLNCGHFFCTRCWSENIFTQVMTNGSIKISCMQNGCDVMLEDNRWGILLSGSNNQKHCLVAIQRRFEQLARNDFQLKHGNQYQKCPNGKCDFVAKLLAPGLLYSNALPQPQSPPFRIKCRCKMTFCSNCSLPWHEPASCQMLKEWAELREKLDLQNDDQKNEAANLHWISANSRPCPGCQVDIEKNQGCNYMCCKNCKYEFCWECMRAWKPIHTNHFSCSNGAEAKNAVKVDLEQRRQRARMALEKSDRLRQARKIYKSKDELAKNHAEMLVHCQQLCSQIVSTPKEFFPSSGISEDMQIMLLKWLAKLCSMRQILLYSEIFAFFIHCPQRDEPAKCKFLELKENAERALDAVWGCIFPQGNVYGELDPKIGLSEENAATLVDEFQKGKISVESQLHQILVAHCMNQNWTFFSE